jgi:acetyl-CoA C-acetyltransferase
MKTHPRNAEAQGVAIVAAARTPMGKRNGILSNTHPVDLLAAVQRAVVERAALDPLEVEQVIGGCVSAVGEQSYNIVRTAWLAAGFPDSIAGTTVDAQCGSGQQAVSLAAALIRAGVVDTAIGCGVESMSRIPIGTATQGPGSPFSARYLEQYEVISQFEAADRIARQWSISRQELDSFGLRSQTQAAEAWQHGIFEDEIVPIEIPDEGNRGNFAARDEGLRSSSIERLSELAPNLPPDGLHTPATSSQISDGAAALLLMSASKARAVGLTPMAFIADQCLIGVHPTLKFTGPIDATRLILSRTKTVLDDFDVIEVNEAFASVVLAWEREVKPDMERVNRNGGAIALGHPLGATGARLLTSALYDLDRSGGNLALVTMCCGGGLGTATVLERG